MSLTDIPDMTAITARITQIQSQFTAPSPTATSAGAAAFADQLRAASTLPTTGTAPLPGQSLLSTGPLAELWRQAEFLLAQLIQRGRELGVIRSDMPEDLLLALLIAVDDAHDRWLFAHWPDLAPADLEQAAERISDTLRRLLSAGER